MKSKILVMVSTLFTASMLVNSFSAQGRSVKVSLPCEVNQIDASGAGVPKPLLVKLEAQIVNNTGAWLAEGKTVYYQLTFMKSGGELTRTTDLGVMVPEGGHAKVWEGAVPPNLISSPKTCLAWYLK
jgi:hypothetical protein